MEVKIFGKYWGAMIVPGRGWGKYTVCGGALASSSDPAELALVKGKCIVLPSEAAGRADGL